MKPRDENKERAIFKATLQLVREKGLAGITMGEIAKKAGLATGTTYVYFKGKDELVNALFIACRKASAEVYFKGYDPAQPFKTGFKTIWLNLLKYRLDKFEEAVFMDQFHHSPFITESTRELTKKLFKPLFSLMDDGKAKQIIKEADTLLLLTYVVGSINEVVKHSHYSKIKLTAEKIEQLFEMCWDGLKA